MNYNSLRRLQFSILVETDTISPLCLIITIVHSLNGEMKSPYTAWCSLLTNRLGIYTEIYSMLFISFLSKGR